MPLYDFPQFKSSQLMALIDPDDSHYLHVYTAVPGSESYEKLRLLDVIGTQSLR